MSHHSITDVLAASTTDTGSHPGLFFFLACAAILSAIIALPIYIVRQVRERRERH